MSNAIARLCICAALFAVWIALVVFQVPGDGQIIDVIKYTLAMLGGYHAGDRINAQPAQAVAAAPGASQAGYAQPVLLIVLTVIAFMLLAGCATDCTSDKQCAKENAEDIGAGIGAALDVLAIPAEIDQSTVTTTRSCTTDRRGDQSCTTIKQSD